MNPKRKIGIVSSCLALLLALPTHADPYGPIADEAFYQPPADLSGYELGALIEYELENEMAPTLFNHAICYRIMYVSLGALGQKVAVTGMAVLPRAPGNGAGIVEGPMDTVVWAHGTVGVGDACAPSKFPRLYHDIWNQYGDVPAQLSKAGFASVCPDYEGLGTPGGHTYLHNASGGSSIIHAVRALRQLGLSEAFETTTHWGVLGHSQGALAARSANVLAETAAPELTCVGSVEVAGSVNANTAVDLVNHLASSSGFPYIGYLVHGIRAIDPGFEASALAGPLLLPVVEAAADECWEEWFARFSGQSPEIHEVLNPDFASQPSVQSYLNNMAHGGSGIGASAPALLIFGGNDELFASDSPLVTSYLADLEAAGEMEFTTIMYNGQGHDGALVHGMKDSIDWLQAQFQLNE